MNRFEIDTVTFFSNYRHSKIVDFFLIQISDFSTNFKISIPVFMVLYWIIRPELYVVASSIIGLIISDQCSKALKKSKNKMRPTLYVNYPDDQGASRSSRSSFCSSHTSNITFISLYFFSLYQNHLILLFVPLMIYSRIYLGAHWVSDTIRGVFVGMFSFLIVQNIEPFLLSLL